MTTTSKKQTPRYRPEVEGLETRLVPAGNVTAQVVGGQVVIQGDGAANGVFLIPQAGHFLVAGFVQGGAATTINGAAPVNGISTATLTGATFNFDIRLGEGNDFLVLSSGIYSGLVTVLAEGGNDIVATNGAAFSGQVNMDTGAGNDILNVQSSFFIGGLNAQLGAGNDVTLLRSSGFAGPATFNGSAGFDALLDLRGNFFGAGVSAVDFAFITPGFAGSFNPFGGFGSPIGGGGGPIGGIFNGIIVK